MEHLPLEIDLAVLSEAPVPAAIRLADPGDFGALRELEELEGRSAGAGPHLLAEDGDTIVAALSLSDGTAVSDPFRRTTETVALLRRCAATEETPPRTRGHTSHPDRRGARAWLETRTRKQGDNTMHRRTLIIAVLSTLTLVITAALTSAAGAAPAASKLGCAGLTGIWSGKTQQELAPLSPDGHFVDWDQHIVVRACSNRLVSLGTSVRYTCPDDTNPMAGDITLSLYWKIGRGPLLTKRGGFSLVVRESRNILTGKLVRLPIPVSISGVLGGTGGSGRFDLSGGGCSGKGSWRARRTSRI